LREMHGGFNAEQAAQLYLKATLLEPVGDFPRRRSVLYLLGELKRISEGGSKISSRRTSDIGILRCGEPPKACGGAIPA